MTRDDIVRMAKEAHKDLVTVDYPGHAGQLDPWTLRLLERFAALVAAAEREACARACDEYVGPGSIFAKVIRERNEQEQPR